MDLRGGRTFRRFSWEITPRGILRGIIHLPGLRGNPERTYVALPVGGEFAGHFHLYTASVIADWQANNDLRLRRLSSQLIRLELSSKIEARRLDATRVEIRVGRLAGTARTKASNLVNVADVGVGVSQILPLLVALLTASKGQIVYVEQPEVHLHPGAEVALAEVLLDAARRGVIIVAETHSLRLIKSIQTQVARAVDLAPLVKLHWFSRGADGATRVDSADMDERGAFGDWPEESGRRGAGDRGELPPGCDVQGRGVKRARWPSVLVIDASVARAAGGDDSSADIAVACTSALREVMDAGLSAAMSEPLFEEWGRHSSVFARKWLVQMFSRKRVHRPAIVPEEAALRRVLPTLSDAGIRRAIEKDLRNRSRLGLRAATCTRAAALPETPPPAPPRSGEGRGSGWRAHRWSRGLGGPRGGRARAMAATTVSGTPRTSSLVKRRTRMPSDSRRACRTASWSRCSS